MKKMLSESDHYLLGFMEGGPGSGRRHSGFGPSTKKQDARHNYLISKPVTRYRQNPFKPGTLRAKYYDDNRHWGNDHALSLKQAKAYKMYGQ